MTDAEILIKILDKARLNGYDGMEDHIYYRQWIFYHEFVKTFFGERLVETDKVIGETYLGDNDYETKYEEIPSWQHHLQQMVLEPEPLKYLKRFL